MTTKTLTENYKKATRYSKTGKVTPAEFNLLTNDYFIGKVSFRDILNATYIIKDEETMLAAVDSLINLTKELNNETN